MNADILRSAGIEYDKGVKRFAGRAQLYEKALAKFPADGTFARIKAARAAGDNKALFAGAHEFKGMCGNIALTSLYDASDTIVSLLRGGEPREEELAAAYARLEAEYGAIREAVLAAMEVTA